MKYNININQYELSKNGDITIQEGAVIDWLFTICGSDSSKISSKRVEGWTWVSLPHLIEDMPLLRIKTNSGASKLIKRIKTLGYIDSKKDEAERKLYVKPTKKLRDLYFSKKVRRETAQVLTETAQVPQDANHNTNIIILNPISKSVSNETDEVEFKDGKEIPPKKKTKKQLRLETPFDFKREFELLGDSHWVAHKIIYNYWKIKGYRFDNYKQFDGALKRELRPATTLIGYNSKDITKAMDYCQQNYKLWTLETIGKRISDLVNKK